MRHCFSHLRSSGARAGFCAGLAFAMGLGMAVASAEPGQRPAEAVRDQSDGLRTGAEVTKPSTRTTIIRPWFDRNDEAAALEAVQVALTEVGDGSSYVWYRQGGRLSGIVQPTQSFEDMLGRVCRHINVKLSIGAYSRHTSAIACRTADGSWVIDG
ncbi:MAG: hypothetical protein R3D67_14725 [Hyphomicrobiaceae bacterium]